METTGNILLSIMKEKGLSYADLSNLTGISKATLQRYLTGTTEKIPYDRVEKMALALGVTVKSLSAASFISSLIYNEKVTTVGARIKARRKELGLSQVELAEAIGEKKQTIYKYENDVVKDIPLSKAIDLAQVLQTSVDELYGENYSTADIENSLTDAYKLLRKVHASVPINEQIKSLRIANGITQEELALKVGYNSRSSIAKVEAGLIDLSQSKIEMFAAALGTTPSYIMGLDYKEETQKETASPQGCCLNKEDFELFYAYHNCEEYKREAVKDLLGLRGKDD